MTVPETWEIRPGHVLDVLRELPEESAQTVVTSPPYWGLRDYGLPPTVWGGDEGCDHEWGAQERGKRSDLLPADLATSTARLGTTDGQRGSVDGGRFCTRCAAWRGSLGLEPTPELYVEHLVGIFREVRRVLRRDGTVWLNLGDCYAARAAQGGQTVNGFHVERSKRIPRGAIQRWGGGSRHAPGLKPKDLVGIPWMVAFALRTDGWWLRSDTVWAKGASFDEDFSGNPVPESVRDRPTRAHEYLFLLTRQARYFWDYEAAKEPVRSNTSDLRKMQEGRARFGGKGLGNEDRLNAANVRTKLGSQRSVGDPEKGRNIRSVWTIPTEPFSGTHFATFPKKLVEPCIRIGTRPGDVVLDPFCGAGTVGVVALRRGRRFLGIELSRRFAEMARRRIEDDAPLLNRVEAP